MKKKKTKMVIYSFEEILRMKGRTDWKRVNATTDEEISRQIAADPDLYELTDEELREFKRVPPEKVLKQTSGQHK